MKKSYVLLVIAFTALSVKSQTINDAIIQEFDKFVQVPESSIHLHLNKSILVQGEDLGFTAYVLDHKQQKPASEVRNLYCQILDRDKKIVKEQMLLVQDGRSNGVFVLDSLFQSGDYTVRAYTNWMRNFKSPHYFEAPLKIITSSEKASNQALMVSAIDIQILPEGGHLVDGVMSVVGISVVDSRGKAIESAVIKLFQDDEVLQTITLDDAGLGRFALIPDAGKVYKINVTHNAKNYAAMLPAVKAQGVLLAIREDKKALIVTLNTNLKTLETINGSNYTVAINGSDKVQTYNKVISGVNNVLAIDIKDLKTGMNQITLFSKDKKIVGQRLYFNYEGFKTIALDSAVVTRDLDSLRTSLKFEDFKNTRLSVSVLPQSTQALDRSQSIISSFKLSPYITGGVENPLAYFTNITPQVRANMDNLLLCKGWVMYDWETIFNAPTTYNYGYERGITVTANLNTNKFKNIVIYPSLYNDFTTIDLNENQDSFVFAEYYPTINEKLIISTTNKKNKVEKATIYPQFSPHTFPSFLSHKTIKSIELLNNNDFEIRPFAKRAEMLDTVLLTSKKMKLRNQRIVNQSLGRVDFFDDADRLRATPIDIYLQQFGIGTGVSNGNFELSSTVVLLDGIVSRDTSILLTILTSEIDYVEIGPNIMFPNKLVITIVTNPLLNPYNKMNFKTTTSYDIPLTFAEPVKFYRPSYYSYSDTFYDRYGVVDWQGDVQLIDGVANFTMPYLGVNKLLFHIQGWSEDGTLIDEIKEVTVAND